MGPSTIGPGYRQGTLKDGACQDTQVAKYLLGAELDEEDPVCEMGREATATA